VELRKVERNGCRTRTHRTILFSFEMPKIRSEQGTKTQATIEVGRFQP
jgi:hypothetical protein